MKGDRQLVDAHAASDDFERRVNAHQMPRRDIEGVTPRLRLKHPSDRSSLEGHGYGFPLRKRGRGIRPTEVSDGHSDRRTPGHDAHVGRAATEPRMGYTVRVDEEHVKRVREGFHELHERGAFPITE